MNKSSPMFALRDSSEMKNFYKNPIVLIGFLALVLILVSFFAPIPFYQQKGGLDALKFQTLLTTSGDITLIIVFEVLTIVFAALSLVFSFLFKNSKGLSAIGIVMGTLMLIFCIFQFIYLTKIGVPKTEPEPGRFVFVITFSYGSLAVILASILLIGLEFYKLGWQGYEVADEGEVAKVEAVETPAVEAVEEMPVEEEKAVEEEPKAEEPAEKKAATKKTTAKKPAAKKSTTKKAE